MLSRRAMRALAGPACTLIGALLVLMAAGMWSMVRAQVQPPQAAARYKLTLLREAHSQWGLDAPVAAFAAQVHQESGWRADAVSRVGARGLAQFMPATARWWCETRVWRSPTACLITRRGRCARWWGTTSFCLTVRLCA